MKESRKYRYLMYLKNNVKFILGVATGGSIALEDYHKAVLLLVIIMLIDFLGMEFYAKFHESIVREVLREER